MCGENDLGVTLFPPGYGSPPRVRGKLTRFVEADCVAGITPACAGKTTDSKLDAISD